MTRMQIALGLAVAVLVAAAGLWLGGAEPDDARQTEPAATSRTTDSDRGLPRIAVADLPPEAHATLALIESHGPFPYDRDGAVFQNREGILPDERRGYYHEYTVETPGSDDRGARRIVTGSRGELYYTDDHYDSFRRIRR